MDVEGFRGQERLRGCIAAGNLVSEKVKGQFQGGSDVQCYCRSRTGRPLGVLSK